MAGRRLGQPPASRTPGTPASASSARAVQRGQEHPREFVAVPGGGSSSAGHRRLSLAGRKGAGPDLKTPIIRSEPTLSVRPFERPPALNIDIPPGRFRQRFDGEPQTDPPTDGTNGTDGTTVADRLRLVR